MISERSCTLSDGSSPIPSVVIAHLRSYRPPRPVNASCTMAVTAR